jgi:hypothetical protein
MKMKMEMGGGGVVGDSVVLTCEGLCGSLIVNFFSKVTRAQRQATQHPCLPAQVAGLIT